MLDASQLVSTHQRSLSWLFWPQDYCTCIAGACDPVFSFYLVSSMVPGKKLKQALWHSPYFMCTAGKGQFKKMHFHSCTASCLPEIQPAFLLEKEQTVASLFFSFPVVFGITHYYYENIATYALLWFNALGCSVSDSHSTEPEVYHLCLKSNSTWIEARISQL